MTASDALLRDLGGFLDARGIIAAPDSATFDQGYRYGAGQSLCVARPATIEALRATIRYCVARQIRLLPQGENTGLVGASSPDDSGEQVVLNLGRLSGIEQFSPLDRTATVLAGTRLSVLNETAATHGLCFPIDLGADPSLGGMVATNTGGARLIRYGDVQRNLLGLEVALMDQDATLLSDLRGLRKDNSGVDWKQLFVGTGGAFGVITRAKVELHRVPRDNLTALLIPSSHAVVPQIVDRLEAALGDMLTACEGMSRDAMAIALKHHPAVRSPFQTLPEYALLIELSSTLPESVGLDLQELLAQAVGACFDDPDPWLIDTIIGRSDEIWAVRHAISDGLKREGRVIAFDVAMPRSALPAFRAAALAGVRNTYPFLKACDFGHCGDGGDHFNLIWPHEAGDMGLAFSDVLKTLQGLIYDLVVEGHGGTFSAEHGVGPHNAAFYRHYTHPAERSLVAGLKSIFDPGRLLGNVDFS